MSEVSKGVVVLDLVGTTVRTNVVASVKLQATTPQQEGPVWGALGSRELLAEPVLAKATRRPDDAATALGGPP